jgi:predicted metal-dependent peptidase
MHPILEGLEKASVQLMLKEPFYGHFFSSLIKEINSNRTESISLGLDHRQQLRLLINPEYWERELAPNGQLQLGAIKHQLLHLIFRHINQTKEVKNLRLFGLASDLSVNQYIDAQQRKKDDLTLGDFPDFPLVNNLAAHEYYKNLQQEWLAVQQTVQEHLEAEDEPQSAGQATDNGQTKEDNGESPKQLDEDWLHFLNKSQKKLWLLMHNSSRSLSEHDNWKEFEQLSNPQQRLLDQQLDDALRNTLNRLQGRGYGNLPGGLIAHLDRLQEALQPNINWKRVLRLFANSSARTRLRNTIRRPSKRYGTSPGIKVEALQKVLVAIDTSGSVQDDELKEFFGEVHHLWKQGAEVLIVECDTEIGNEYRYLGFMPSVISGRGGTSFEAPIRYANEHYHPDAILYFTDGYGAAPKQAPRAPILWLITDQGIDDNTWDFLPGRKVKMKKQL